MNHSIFEILMTLFYIFNNPIAIFAVVSAFIVSIIICRFTDVKIVISCIGFSLFMAVLGLIMLVAGNSPDYLGVLLFFILFSVVMTIVSTVYYILKRGKNNEENKTL